MKLLLFAATLLLSTLQACSLTRSAVRKPSEELTVLVDLKDVQNDKVRIELTIPKSILQSVSASQKAYMVFRFPAIIPGTYAIADYGRYVEDFKAYDRSGDLLPVLSTDSNTFVIKNSQNLKRLTYLVNDTYDKESGQDVFSSEKEIFSPAGTNIVRGEHFMLNFAGFIGYINDRQETPYKIQIVHPGNLYGTTAKTDLDPSDSSDLFRYSSFADVVDNPAMYCRPDTSTFNVGDMQVVLGVYSRNRNINAKTLSPYLEKMMRAQKNYLGDLNNTRRYAVICYLTSMKEGDARGMGALEHNNSTVAVFRESITSRDLIDVISHEFFHTVTPLKVHSREIQYFDFNVPKMSRHLWFYEGITEYFANLFQVNQGLITEDQFFDKIAGKEEASRDYNDTLSFTSMSKNVLDPVMKKQYPNVYQKGALVAMCLDVILRDESKGERGILDLVKSLSGEFGPGKPFEDSTLISHITQISSKRIGDFLVNHVQNGKPIDYQTYLGLMGVTPATVSLPEPIVFVSQGTTYLEIDPEKKEVLVDMPDKNNAFLNNMGLKDKDVLLEMNGLSFDTSDGSQVLMSGYDLQEGSPVKMKILRAGKPMELTGTVKLNYADGSSYRFTDQSKKQLKDLWLTK